MTIKSKARSTHSLILSERKGGLTSEASTALSARTSGAGALAKVRFGSVTVEAKAPGKAEVRRNVVTGQSALERAAFKMSKPGVILSANVNIPAYHADPKVPGRLVRVLNGASQPGTFINGKFRPSK